MAFFGAVKSPEVPRPFFQKPVEPSPAEERPAADERFAGEERPAVEERPPVEERPAVEERPRVEERRLKTGEFKSKLEPKSKVMPKYVEVPALREHGFGPRNLFWGLGAFFVAVVLLLAALFFAGPKVMLSLATALMTFTALFVLSRIHVFRQRNGGFLALAVVCLLGTVVPLLEFGFTALKGRIGGFAATSQSPAPGAPAMASESGVPLLTHSFALTPPQGAGKRVRAVKDVKVMIDGLPFLIKAGDTFPFLEVKGGAAFFAVRDMRVSLPAGVVEVIDPSTLAKGVAGGKAEPDPGDENTSGLRPLPPPAPTSADLEMITASAKTEAMRLYPALAVRGSLENAAFISEYLRLQKVKEAGGGDYFADPEWPLALAEMLAQSGGWVRGAAPATVGSGSAVGPAPVLDAPVRRGVIEDDEPVPPKATPAIPRGGGGSLPPVDTLDAGSGLPGGAR